MLLFTFTSVDLCVTGSAVIAKLLRMTMLSDDDDFLTSENVGDK